MKLQISVLTTGEDVLWETLDSVKEFTEIPYSLHVWYQMKNKDEKPDFDFYKRILTYTNDVVLCSSPHKCPAAVGYSQVYLNYDYLLSLSQDTVLMKGYLKEVMKYFHNFRKVAFVGQGTSSTELKGGFEINNPINLPDSGGIYSREVVNDIGGLGAFFPRYGFDLIEWMARAIVRGWKIIHIKNIINHGGRFDKKHGASEKTNGLDDIIKESGRLQMIADKMGYKGYNWWADRL